MKKSSLDVVDVIGCFLIDVIVDPVGEKQMSVCTPGDQRWILGIIVLIVVGGQGYVRTFSSVAPIFCVECVGGVFQMTGDEEFASLAGHHHAYAAVGRFGDEVQFGMREDVFASHLCVSAVGHREDIVESAEDGQLRL